MYRHLEVAGFNAYKPAVYNRVRLYKAFELRRVRPQTVVLGTSRTHLGIGCGHAALARLPGPCYNLAFDGATTREMYHYLRHAHALRRLRHVVLGLDAYHTSAAPSITRPDFDELILLDGSTPAWWRILTGDLRLLASLDTVAASLATLRAQDAAEPSWFAEDGQRLGEVFFHRAGETFVEQGPRAYFDEIDRLEVGFQAPPRTPTKQAAPSPPMDPGESSLAYVGRIVEFCRREGIDLRIFITPSHVHQLEIATETGGWSGIEDGKRALVRLLAADAARHAGQPPVPLVDFSGYSSITTEALPARGSRQEMDYYWDSSHFKARVGDYVLDRLFDMQSASPPPDFGVRLEPANIELFLAAQRAGREAYRTRFPGETTELRALVRKGAT